MTTIHLAQRLARRTKWLRLHEVPIAELDELVMCMNQATHEWYQGVAPVQKSGILTEILKEPADLTISILDGAKGFSVTGTTPAFLVADMTQAIGCTVIVGDDPKWNVVMSESQLALPYSGAGGAQNMRVMFNALHLGENDINLTGPIFTRRVNGSARTMLTKSPFNQLHANGFQVGDPLYYDLIPIETWEASEPRFALRVYPAPSVDTIIETEVARRPLIFKVADLVPPGRSIPIGEFEIDNIILPIAAAKMIPAGLLDNTRFDARAIMSESAAATIRLQSVQAHIDTTPNLVGTPYGF
jgi:hypothetical protein